MKYLIYFGIISFIILSIYSCKKCKTTDDIWPIAVKLPINKDLVGVPLDTLRKYITGVWLRKSRELCGVAGCNTTLYANGEEDSYHFIPIDTIKRVSATGVVTIYAKADVAVSATDNSWIYRVPNSIYNINIYRITNDTLILNEFCNPCQSRLVRKP
jgi:hypothetical protein